MAQHDYNIANQTGLEFRADLNGMAEAIVTQNSGPTEPTVTYAGMKWLDTSTSPPIEKRRNAANNAWVTTLTEAGRAVAGAADAAAQRTAMGAAASTNPSFTGLITGDFSNTTVANRVMFQTSTANGTTSVGLIPNGTATTANYSMFSNAGASTAYRGQFAINATEVSIQSNYVGPSPTYIPMTFYTGGAERMRIDVSGNVLVTSPALLGYGPGAGGAVIQSTSKSTAVTLNKPTGRIITDNQALAGGAMVQFILNNSLISADDNVVVTLNFNANYSVKVVWTIAGSCAIVLKNESVGSLSDAVQLNFAIIKGAIA